MAIWYILRFEVNEIVIASAVFSSISLLVTFLAIYTERQAFLNRQRVLVQFTLIGLSTKDIKLQTRTHGITLSIANLLGVHKELIYIEKPCGFRFKVNLHVNYVQYKDVDYKALFEEALSNGTLAEIVRDQWDLVKQPMIKDFKYEEIQSEYQLMNMVEIVMPRKRISNRAGIEAHNRISSEQRSMLEGAAEGVLPPQVSAVIETPFEPGQYPMSISEEGPLTRD